MDLTTYLEDWTDELGNKHVLTEYTVGHLGLTLLTYTYVV